MKKILTLLFILTNIASCDKQKSSTLYSPQLTTEKVEQSGGTLEYEITPKAEILFVIDNSASMQTHIDNVSKNIDKFVDAFTKKSPIEFNLGIVSVYDARTYLSVEYQDKFKDIKKFGLGEFRPIRKSETEIIEKKSFISSNDENLKELLKNSLKIGVQDLKSGGPEVEESFSPVAKVFGLGSPSSHPEFSLGKDAYKIIFFVTDASDASTLAASELYYRLVASANGDTNKVMAFGAIVPKNATNCKKDPGIQSPKLEEFLTLTSRPNEPSNIVSLCEDFGSRFADFGRSIKSRTAVKMIPLYDHIPVISDDPNETLRVFYGSQEIPMETHASIIGFTYDPGSNIIYLNPDLDLKPESGAKLRITYTAVHPANIRAGRLKIRGT